MPVEPNIFDDERLAKIRSNQSDSIVQYYIIKKDIEMSTGKICAQVAHGAQMFLLSYFEKKKLADTIPRGGKNAILADIVDEWLAGSFRKVILGASSKDFEKVKNEVDVFCVKDAGLTEVDLGTETVLVTWPMLKSKQPDILKKLQIFKK